MARSAARWARGHAITAQQATAQFPQARPRSSDARPAPQACSPRWARAATRAPWAGGPHRLQRAGLEFMQRRPGERMLKLTGLTTEPVCTTCAPGTFASIVGPTPPPSASSAAEWARAHAKIELMQVRRRVGREFMQGIPGEQVLKLTGLTGHVQRRVGSFAQVILRSAQATHSCFHEAGAC
jgi:hypothetical protein